MSKSATISLDRIHAIVKTISNCPTTNIAQLKVGAVIYFVAYQGCSDMESFIDKGLRQRFSITLLSLFPQLFIP